MTIAITEKELEQAKQSYFEDGKFVIKQWPSKLKYRYIVVGLIAEVFHHDQTYSEPEMNATIKPIYSDFFMIRRYLVDFKFFDRDPYGRVYKKTGKQLTITN